MKFSQDDYKGFVIGVLASITAVIVWDVIKKRYQIFNYTKKETGGILKEFEEIKDEIR